MQQQQRRHDHLKKRRDCMTSVVLSSVPGSDNAKSQDDGVIFKTIGEVSDMLDLPQHVLRFWESKFQELKPLKRSGGRRYFRQEDVILLRQIKDLLYTQGLTIRGAQLYLKQNHPQIHKKHKSIKKPEQLDFSADEGKGTRIHNQLRQGVAEKNPNEKNQEEINAKKLNRWANDLNAMLSMIESYRLTGSL